LKDSVWLPICQGCYRKGLAQNEESVQEAEQAMRDYQTSRTADSSKYPISLLICPI